MRRSTCVEAKMGICWAGTGSWKSCLLINLEGSWWVIDAWAARYALWGFQGVWKWISRWCATAGSCAVPVVKCLAPGGPDGDPRPVLSCLELAGVDSYGPLPHGIEHGGDWLCQTLSSEEGQEWWTIGQSRRGLETRREDKGTVFTLERRGIHQAEVAAPWIGRWSLPTPWRTRSEQMQRISIPIGSGWKMPGKPCRVWVQWKNRVFAHKRKERRQRRPKGSDNPGNGIRGCEGCEWQHSCVGRGTSWLLCGGRGIGKLRGQVERAWCKAWHF